MAPFWQYSVRFSNVFVLIVNCNHVVHVWIEQVVQMLWGLVVGEVVLEHPDDDTDRVRYGFKKRTKLLKLRHPTFWYFGNFLGMPCGVQILFYFKIKAKSHF